MEGQQAPKSHVQEIEELRKENQRLVAELKELKSVLAKQYNELHHQHQELSDSIDYAQRIQRALHPPDYYIDDVLPENFILYLPKDVVSGDFYFVEAYQEHVVFAAVDCTGHGIPGALMSVVGFNYLDQAVKQNGITNASEILSLLDEGVNERLRQTGGESGVNDGMDLGLCSLNKNTMELQYAGAYNPLYIVTEKTDSYDYPIRAESENHHLFEVKADKLPIGVNTDGVTDIYTNHRFMLKKGQTIYLLSDGYADQFGGPRGKKMKYRKLRELLVSIQDQSMKQQMQTLLDYFHQWQGDQEQVDDVIIMGVRI
jgi:serine phosphatase RsbU (regulator of sigma subunit)